MPIQCHESSSNWDGSSVNASALHLLAQQCLNITDNDHIDNHFVRDLVAPNTFFVQLVRLSLSLCIITVLFSLYNSVRVLEQPITSTATCSLYWVVFFSFAALKSLLLIILVPASRANFILIEQGGFIAVTITQLAASYVLYLALHHETQFRSSEYATIDSPPRRSCLGLRSLRHMCSWHRLLVFAITMVPLLYLIAMEIAFHIKNKNENLPSAVVWVFILTLPLPRLAAMGVAIYLVVRPRSHLQPTILAKVFLFVATMLSIMEDIPNSVTTAAPVHKSCQCLLGVLTVYDILQLLGLLAFFFYVMFVRSQYLRVEQESKLNLVEGLQKLLEINGRKDVIKRVYST